MPLRESPGEQVRVVQFSYPTIFFAYSIDLKYSYNHKEVFYARK